MIIDVHAHVDRVPQLGWDMPASAIVDGMDEVGIDLSVIMSITDGPALTPEVLERTAHVVESSRGRLLAFARIHPWYPESTELLRRAVVQLAFRGLKLHPVSTMAQPGGEPTLRLLRVAADLGVPTMFHCADDLFTTPWEIAPAAKKVPDATIILAHCGGYRHGAEAVDVAEEHENVLLDTSCIPYPEVLSEAVRRIGPERVLFGSDAPGASPRIELAKVRGLGLPEPALEAVLGANAERLLGLVR